MFLKRMLTEAGYEHGSSSKSDLFVREKRSWSLKGSTAHFRRADARTILTYIFIYLSFPGALIFNTNFKAWFKELSWKQESSSSDERTSKSDDNASNFSPPRNIDVFRTKREAALRDITTTLPLELPSWWCCCCCWTSFENARRKKRLPSSC